MTMTTCMDGTGEARLVVLGLIQRYHCIATALGYDLTCIEEADDGKDVHDDERRVGGE